MFGEEIGSLSIYIPTNASGSETKVWSQKGHISDNWIFAQVPMNPRHHKNQFQVNNAVNRMLIDPAGALFEIQFLILIGSPFA